MSIYEPESVVRIGITDRMLTFVDRMVAVVPHAVCGVDSLLGRRKTTSSIATLGDREIISHVTTVTVAFHIVSSRHR